MTYSGDDIADVTIGSDYGDMEKVLGLAWEGKRNHHISGGVVEEP